MITAGSPAVARQEATAVLAAAGVASPAYDAIELLAHVCGVPRGMLPMVGELDDAQAARYAALVSARAGREPLQHLLGSAGFYGLELAVGPGVFVPRPETEVLVQSALHAIDGLDRPVVIDLCAGSGAIALAIAHHRPDARVSAVERSPHALRWLRRNAEAIEPAVDIVQADVLGELPFASYAADLVTCNPPYVPRGTAVAPEVGEHDPADAVFAGTDGLSLITPLAPRIAHLLRPGGTVFIEHDDSHQNEVLGLLAGTGSYEQIAALRDLAGRPRFVSAVRRPLSGG